MKKNFDPIGLAEAVKIIESNEWMGDPRIEDFMERVNCAASEILAGKDQGDDYLMGAVAFIQSMTLAYMLQLKSISLLDALMLVQDENFILIIASAFKASIGLAALEELR